jgi:hypothetical protein
MEARTINLNTLVDSHGWGIKDLVQRCGRSPSFWSDRLKGRRPIGEKVARSVEESLGLIHGWLDQPHGRGTQIPADSAHTEASISLTDALCVIGDALDRLDDATRMKAADALLTFAKAPDSRRMREMLATLLDQGESSRVV